MSYKGVVIASIIFFVCSGIFIYSCQTGKNAALPKNSSELAVLDSSVFKIPSVISRLASISKAVQESRVLILTGKNAEEMLAQEILVGFPEAQPFFRNEKGEFLLNEIFAVHKALPADLQPGMDANNCYKIELYNYAQNRTLSAIVDIALKKPIAMNVLEMSAPDVPEHLKKIAVDIAINSALVKKELGNDAPEIKDAQMAYTKTALNNSKCERSLHLCVAPTFVKGEKALWSIVDLTDLRLVGTRWTFVGDAGPVRVSERKIQNEKISSCYCEQENEVNKNGWKVKYMLTSSDGLRVADISFNNKKILKSAKLVDWHVSYSNTDGFGYSDGIGCPTFSMSAVTAWDAPTVSDLMENGKKVGFVIEQIFKSAGWPKPCNYNYVQRFEFYDDGSFRPSAASIGRGCGSDGTYRPVFRVAFEGKNTISSFDGSQFKPWSVEQWNLQKENFKYSKEGYAFQIQGNTNYFVEPNRGQFGDKSRGDNAYTYVTKFKASEGESDLVTIGPCCNNGFEQGPEKFIEAAPESIANEEIVFWYVPQMKNDDKVGQQYCWAEAKINNGVYQTVTYPCFVGPKFIAQK